jgi:predicted secreted protein
VQDSIESNSGNKYRAVKHWIIAASNGDYNAMNILRIEFNRGYVCRDVIKSTLTAYNTSCAEMRSKARDAYIKLCNEN